jgi:hypothetical protein
MYGPTQDGAQARGGQAESAASAAAPTSARAHWETGQWPGSIVQGYFNDHAVPGNTCTLGTFRRRQLCLCRQKTRLNWRRFKVLLHCWIPTQRILHPFPNVHFDAMHLR